jgi:hypothetical protein
MIMGALASRRRVNPVHHPATRRRTPALPGKTIMAAGQTFFRWNAAIFQRMTFDFGMSNLSANESEQIQTFGRYFDGQ